MISYALSFSGWLILTVSKLLFWSLTVLSPTLMCVSGCVRLQNPQRPKLVSLARAEGPHPAERLIGANLSESRELLARVDCLCRDRVSNPAILKRFNPYRLRARPLPATVICR
jgi:hypothetical protein